MTRFVALLFAAAALAACSSLMIEVESVMGRERAGGKLPEVLFGRLQYLEAKNPMREEKSGDELVLYYYTDVTTRDDRITDDELTPVLLRDGKVVGVGRQFLKR